MCDEILKQAVEGISDLITTPGTIGNIDFADIRAVMENSGSALMGVGTASGEKRAEEAARLQSIPHFSISLFMEQRVCSSLLLELMTSLCLKFRTPPRWLPTLLILQQKLFSELLTMQN